MSARSSRSRFSAIKALEYARGDPRGLVPSVEHVSRDVLHADWTARVARHRRARRQRLGDDRGARRVGDALTAGRDPRALALLGVRRRRLARDLRADVPVMTRGLPAPRSAMLAGRLAAGPARVPDLFPDGRRPLSAPASARRCVVLLGVTAACSAASRCYRRFGGCDRDRVGDDHLSPPPPASAHAARSIACWLVHLLMARAVRRLGRVFRLGPVPLPAQPPARANHAGANGRVARLASRSASSSPRSCCSSSSRCRCGSSARRRSPPDPTASRHPRRRRAVRVERALSRRRRPIRHDRRLALIARRIPLASTARRLRERRHRRASAQLHVPVNRPVVIQLSSKDVIHSFGVPAMRVKQDAVPGLFAPVWFTPTTAGQFEIACSQLCGLAHYRMRGVMTVESDADVPQVPRRRSRAAEIASAFIVQSATPSTPIRDTRPRALSHSRSPARRDARRPRRRCARRNTSST